MIRVNQLVSRATAGECLQLRTSSISGITITARDLRRSIAFYSRVFGFRVADDAREARPSVTMVGPGDVRLAIHGNGAIRAVPLHRHWGFAVDDLEAARAMIWDLGVSVARDNGEPDHIERWSNGRTLSIHDPDGNEVELVEAGNKQPVPA
ncbi:MAG: VOC family protein [Woeseiaceae bacterium]